MPKNQAIYSVSQLNSEARRLLESQFRTIWIIGEISNLSCPSSGHIYFSLKDKTAQVRCAMFRMARRRVRFDIENGQEVLLEAQVSLYETRGDYQLIISHMELAGDGKLQIAFEKLKKKLAADGLFDEDHKKPLPEFPQRIGVITSATGAAIRDILTVLNRRFASTPVVIYPSMVQGDQAAAQLTQAIETANQRQECDVIILARGGGSLEDLWPFNEEVVARAIFASEIPVISGVGHEIDFTIADFVADVRAATPSAAAERACPDHKKFLHQFVQVQSHLIHLIQMKLQHIRTHFTHLSQRLRHPGQRIREQTQQVDFLEQQLMNQMQRIMTQKKNQWQQLQTQLHAQSPKIKIANTKNQLSNLALNLNQQMQFKLKSSQQKLGELSRALDAISPLNTLQRGYSIITDNKTGDIVSSIKQVKEKGAITARLAEGQLNCIIKEILPPR